VPTPLRAVRLPSEQAVPALRRLWDAGDAVLPLDVDAPDERIRSVLTATRPATLTELVEGRERTVHLDDPAPVTDDVVLVIATSGSTGAVKGVELTADALQASTEASVARLGGRPGDRWLVALPLHHIAGLQCVLRSWLVGGNPLLVDPGDTPTIATAEADHVALVPAQLARLIEVRADLRRFRTVLLGGARPDEDAVANLRASGVNIVVSYGMTETAGGCVYDGVPLDGVEVAIRGDGRIRLRGPVLFRGYRMMPMVGGRLPAARDPDGWFTTGDVGTWKEGRLHVRGRADDVIVTGGENVPAASVAEALRTHPRVADAGVIGRDDPGWGQVVVAVVVPSDPANPPQLHELRGHVRTIHPRSWAPRDLVLIDHLPRDGLGKVSRAALEAAIQRR
jgi:o-succinylbenzoate---CoA ligase